MKQAYLIHLTIIFILLLVIYGSAQETQEAQEQPSQTFFYATHSIFIYDDGLKIDGENGTAISTGDLTYPPSGIVDVVELNGTKGVIFEHSLAGEAGKTQIYTTVLTQTTMPLDVSGDIDGVNISYLGTANGTHGAYNLYQIGNETISLYEPTLVEINGDTYMLYVNQNTLTISKVKPISATISNALIVELMLGIIVGGLIIWSQKSGKGLLS